jgi:hypothetical protein
MQKERTRCCWSIALKDGTIGKVQVHNALGQPVAT